LQNIAEYHLFYRALLQKRGIILRSLPIEASSYRQSLHYNALKACKTRQYFERKPQLTYKLQSTNKTGVTSTLISDFASIFGCLVGMTDTVWCSVLQCVAVCCSSPPPLAAQLAWPTRSIAVCCSVWQFVLFCFGVLWRASARLHLLAAELALPKLATNMFNSLLTHVKSRGNTLQNTARHCNILQDTATHACHVKHNVQETSLLLPLTFCTLIQPHYGCILSHRHKIQPHQGSISCVCVCVCVS